jgi:broad specificity phosphatase PhoE
MASHLTFKIADTSRNYKFSFVDGFFIDYVKAAEQCPGAKVTTQPHLGILDREYDGERPDRPDDAQRVPQWERFTDYINRLNEHSEQGESYKLLFIIRHGFGVHNEVMEKVGSEAWKVSKALNLSRNKAKRKQSDWSHRNGDGDLIWADAHLVDAGINQAQNLARFWIESEHHDGMPLPETLYTSPLARCLETTKLVFTPVLRSHQRSPQPIVKEFLREYLTDHTCDRRSSKSWIHENYPDYIMEDGFTEEDILWKTDKTETLEEHVIRKQRLLEDIFAHDESPFISLTTHSYAISALLKVVGAPKFRVGEGVMVPLFVKAEKVAKDSA